MKTLMLYDHQSGIEVILDEEDDDNSEIMKKIEEVDAFLARMEQKCVNGSKVSGTTLRKSVPSKESKGAATNNVAHLPLKTATPSALDRGVPSFSTVREAADFLSSCVRSKPGPILTRPGMPDVENIIGTSMACLFPPEVDCNALCKPANLSWNRGSGISIDDLRDIGDAVPGISILRTFLIGAAASVRLQPPSITARAVEAFRITCDYWRLWGDELCYAPSARQIA